MEEGEIKEIIKEEIVEVIEIVEKKEEEITPEKSGKVLAIITIILIIILVGLIGFIVVKKYPKIASLINSNKYGFDYNINNIKSYDWDTLLTDKKIARALGTAEKNISSAKKPDYAWILTEPETFVNEVICGSLADQQFLDEENADYKNLLNVNVMICKDTAKTKELFDSRRDDIKKVVNEENGISIKKLDDVKGFGTDAYYYLVEKKTPASGDQPETFEYFSGLIFKRGPFMVQIEESENPGSGIKISQEKFRTTIAQMIDTGLKRSLALF